jgi:hypothetical protein
MIPHPHRNTVGVKNCRMSRLVGQVVRLCPEDLQIVHGIVALEDGEGAEDEEEEHEDADIGCEGVFHCRHST